MMQQQQSQYYNTIQQLQNPDYFPICVKPPQQEEPLLEVVLVLDYNEHSGEEKLTFTRGEFFGDIDIMIQSLCAMKAILVTDEIKLCLDPDFIILDIDCIEDGDKIILKNASKVIPLQAKQKADCGQAMKNTIDNIYRVKTEVQNVNNMIKSEHCDGEMGSSECTQPIGFGSSINLQYPNNGFSFGGGGRRGRRPRGRPPGGILTTQQSYYHAIKKATSGQMAIDHSTLVETPDFLDFDFNARNRDELVHMLKSVAARKGFKAIIPFTDRNNSVQTKTSFCCSLAGTSVRKRSTNCPFKVTYIKYVTNPYYKLQPGYMSFHTHTLPVEEYLNKPNDEQGTEQQVSKETEHILEILKKKEQKMNKEYTESSDQSQKSEQQSSQSSNEGGSKKKSKEKKRVKKRKSKKDKKDKKERGNSGMESYKSPGSENSQSSQEILIFDE